MKNTLFFVKSAADAVETARAYLKVQTGAEFETLGDWPEHAGTGQTPMWMRISKESGNKARLDFFSDKQVHDQLAQVQPNYESGIKFFKGKGSFEHIHDNVFAVRDASGLRYAAIAYATACHDDSPHIEIEGPHPEKYPSIVSFRSPGHGHVIITSSSRRKQMKRAVKALKQWEERL
uniref:Uncharacterized protein n=1 Tax=Pseudomonas phage HRDY3 TaxID=3236930 RepID=A0AB39CDR0_9VIRU